MEKMYNKYSKLRIVYSDSKDYAVVTNEDTPEKKGMLLFLWDEKDVMHLQEIERKIEAENMEKSKIPYCSLEKKSNKMSTAITIAYTILILLGVIYVLWKF